MINSSVERTKKDLKEWYNSAFYGEDRRLIKDIHERLFNPPPISAPPLVPIKTHKRNNARAPLEESTRFVMNIVQGFPPLPGTANHVLPGTPRGCEPPSSSGHDGTNTKTAPDSSRRGPAVNITSSVHHPPNKKPMPLPGRPGSLMYSAAVANSLPETSYPSSDSRYQSTSHAIPSQSSNDQQTPQASQQSQNQRSSNQNRTSNFRTLLITDSLMRGMKGDLGINHESRVINLGNAGQLTTDSTRRSIVDCNPDFIYVHLGINDFQQGRTPEFVVGVYEETLDFVARHLPRAKLILSLPLLTSKFALNKHILELRNLTFDLQKRREPSSNIHVQLLFINTNRNFDATPRSSQTRALQNPSLFTRDGIHLSATGSDLIMMNYRHEVHLLTRRILGKTSISMTKT